MDQPNQTPVGGEDVSFPSWLSVASVRIPIAADRVEYEALRKTLSALPQFHESPERDFVYGIMSCEPQVSDCHAHLAIGVGDEGEIRFELSVFPGTHGDTETEFENAQNVLPLITGAVRDPENLVGSIGLEYALSMENWAPVVALPFEAPDVLGLPGAKIAGVDFEFDEPTPEQPIARAFVSTYDSIKRMAVKLLVRESGALTGDIIARMVRRSQKSLPLFARQMEERQDG